MIGSCHIKHSFDTDTVTVGSPNPLQVGIGPTATVILTIAAPTGTPPGPYTVKITGQGGGYFSRQRKIP